MFIRLSGLHGGWVIFRRCVIYSVDLLICGRMPTAKLCYTHTDCAVSSMPTLSDSLHCFTHHPRSHLISTETETIRVRCLDRWIFHNKKQQIKANKRKKKKRKNKIYQRNLGRAASPPLTAENNYSTKSRWLQWDGHI